MFDAGAIQAHLDVETQLFDRKLTAAEERVKRFENAKHEIKISAVFDNASMGRARQMFTALDQQLSRDAMARLRSSPQGSVLGALNALFSPHPVTGAPSPQQAASAGLLGRIVQAPGGGLPGNQNSVSQLLLGQAIGRTGAGGTAHVVIDNVSDLANAVNGPGSSPNVTPPDPNAASNANNTRLAAQASQAAAQNSAQAAASAKQAAQDNANSNRSLISRLGGLFGGGGGGGGGSFLGSFLGSRGGGGGLAALIPGGSPGGAVRGVAGGIGPGILGLGVRTAGIIGLGGAALGGLPALLGGVAPLIPALAGIRAAGALFKGAVSNVSPLTQLNTQIQNEQTAGLGATAAGAKQIAGQQAQLAQGLAALPAAQRQMYTAITNIQNWWQNFTGSMAPAFGKALTTVSGMLTQGPLSNAIQTFFRQSLVFIQPLLLGLGDLASTVLPLLGKSFAAAAPLLRPILDGLGQLVAGILPGLNTLVKAAAPAVNTLFGGLGQIGRDLGQMFAILAPAITASAPILRALLDLIGGLLPIVGELASVFARALGPVFVQFAGVVKALLPFLTIVGHVLAALAGAILGDLVAAFTALAQLLIGIAPALKTFATAFSQVFNVLENTGVFAIIGDALEALVKPLTVMITAILNGLTPILPPLIGFISKLSGILTAGLAAAITALLPPLTQLALVALTAITQLLPILLPLFTTLTQILTAAFVRVIQDLATALTFVVRAIPASALRDIALGFLAIWAAIKVGGLLSAATNPVLLIATAVGLVIVGIVELATHWREVWTNIKNWADDAWKFLRNVFHNGIVQDILAVWSVGLIPLAEHWQQVWGNIKNWADDAWHFLENIFHNGIVQAILGIWSFGLIPLAEHWKTVWNDVKTVAQDFWSWLSHTFGTDVANFFTRTLPNAFSAFVTDAGRILDGIRNAVETPVNWVITNVLDNLIKAFDWISSKVGGPNIPLIPTIGGGGSGGGGSSQSTGAGTGGIRPHAQRGLKIPGYGGGDRIPILAEAGELMLPKEAAKDPLAILLASMYGVPGYSAGGLISGIWHDITGGVTDIARITAAIATGNGTALANVIAHMIPGGTGGAIGDMAALLVDIPKTLVKAVVSRLIGAFGVGGSGSAGLGGGVSGNVQSYSGTVLKALAMLGLPAADLGLVLHQMQTESGGNPLIVNRWDSNWLAGHPSVGLMQVIAGTFARWAGPFLRTGPFEYGVSVNPLANIYSALNYAVHSPGVGIGTGPGQLGSGHGYANGGPIREPVIGFGLRTGERYSFAENGTEWVSKHPPGAMIGSVSIQLPDGQSVARALQELNFWLNVAKQQGWQGALPNG